MDGTHPEIKVLDGMSDGDVGVQLNVKHHRERTGREEDMTDDVVFKELINIVMDVFSNKSEKCMLTFELPVESGVLKEISSKQLVMEYGSDVTSNASKSDILIPLTESKHSKKSLNRRKVPIAKNSRNRMKKKFKKRLNPIVQTALSPKPGFTDLEKLFRICPKQKHCRGSQDRRERHTGSSRYTADEWRNSAESDAHLTNDISNLTDETTHLPQSNIDTDTFSNLYAEFKCALQALQGLAHSQERITEKFSFGKLSYHIEAIQRHIEGIRSLSLPHDSQSVESISTVPQIASTEGSEGPNRKNKVGVRIIRIGAKMSRKSVTDIAPHSQKQRQNYESKTRRGLDEILEKYHRVKKEETEIVQVLLGKLGFHKDRIHRKRKKIRPKRSERGMCERIGEQEVQSCDAAAAKLRLPETEQNASEVQDALSELNNSETLKGPLNNTDSELKTLNQTYSLEKKRSSKQISTVKHKNKPRKNRKRQEAMEELRDTVSQRLRNFNSANNFPVTWRKDAVTVFNERSGDTMENPTEGEMKNAADSMEIQSTVSSKEDRMMRRIQGAAKRLEYMHNLVEKKLDRLSKQQKELNRKITDKTVENYTPRESQSNEGSQNDACELPKESTLNLSTEIEELICQPYRSTKVLESETFNETLKCNVDEPKYGKEVSEEEKMSADSLCRLETQGKLNEGQFRSGSSQNYICNYMMELRRKEPELVRTGSMENQHASEHGKIFSSKVLTNEFQDSSSTGHENPPATSRQSLTAKENEGEIIEESLFARPHSSIKSAQKTIPRKKKKRVIHTPSCVLS